MITPAIAATGKVATPECIGGFGGNSDKDRKDVTMENKVDFEQINLINQLDEDDKVTVFKIIDTMLTKKKFKDFFNKNIAAL